MKQSQYVGIPTLYKGYRFRSRLEAKWAKFFDLLGWLWEYEPFDCDGWIPDFILLGKTSVLVEVKPIVTYDLAVEAKIDKANQEHQVLLVGVMPLWRTSRVPEFPDYPGIFLGWLRDLNRTSKVKWSEAVVRRWGDSPFGFCQYCGTTYDRMSGKDDDDFVDLNARSSYKTLQALWARAQNETQWNKK